MKWPVRYRLWQMVHGVFNSLAWRFATKLCPDGVRRSDDTRLLWKLNNWAGEHYIDWYVHEVIRRHKDDHD